ncbi:hypothetical protein KUTeg_006839, partial [Tegillarca granosa]
MNPKFTVPTLQHGEKVVTESLDIVRYLDQQVTTEPTLFPDPKSEAGKNVEEWCQKLDAIRIEQLTFGVFLNQELSVSGVKMPDALRKRFTVEAIRKKHKLAEDKMKQYAEKYPEFREAYLSKIRIRKEFTSGEMTTKDRTSKCLDDLELVLDEVENQIQKTKSAQGPNSWLIGTDFTAADIILTNLLDRLNMVGLLERYCSESKRPLLKDYFDRLASKTSVQKVRAQTMDSVKVMFYSRMKQAAPSVLGLTIAAVAIGIETRFWTIETVAVSEVVVTVVISYFVVTVVISDVVETVMIND